MHVCDQKLVTIIDSTSAGLQFVDKRSSHEYYNLYVFLRCIPSVELSFKANFLFDVIIFIHLPWSDIFSYVTVQIYYQQSI
jgi:hypothetical protein